MVAGGSCSHDPQDCGICWSSLVVDLFYYALTEFLPLFMILFLIRPDNQFSKNMNQIYISARNKSIPSNKIEMGGENHL